MSTFYSVEIRNSGTKNANFFTCEEDRMTSACSHFLWTSTWSWPSQIHMRLSAPASRPFGRHKWTTPIWTDAGSLLWGDRGADCIHAPSRGTSHQVVLCPYDHLILMMDWLNATPCYILTTKENVIHCKADFIVIWMCQGLSDLFHPVLWLCG